MTRPEERGGGGGRDAARAPDGRQCHGLTRLPWAGASARRGMEVPLGHKDVETLFDVGAGVRLGSWRPDTGVQLTRFSHTRYLMLLGDCPADSCISVSQMSNRGHSEVKHFGAVHVVSGGEGTRVPHGAGGRRESCPHRLAGDTGWIREEAGRDPARRRKVQATLDVRVSAQPFSRPHR